MNNKDYAQVGVGAVVFDQDRVLLVKRLSPPAQNQWAIPGGKVQFGESLQSAAEREIFEETGLRIRAREPIYSFEVIEKTSSGNIAFHYVVIDLAADFIDGELRAADDAKQAAWVDREMFRTIDVNHYTRDLLATKYHFPDQAALRGK